MLYKYCAEYFKSLASEIVEMRDSTIPPINIHSCGIHFQVLYVSKMKNFSLLQTTTMSFINKR